MAHTTVPGDRSGALMAADRASSSLFGDVVQPDSLSLFSSTSSNPFALWMLQQDDDLPEDSGIRLVIDQTDETASKDPGITHDSLVLRAEETTTGSISEPVLHIQSPAIRGTFIRSPPDDKTQLGIQLPNISFQFRAIGSARPLCFEIGVRDEAGRRAAIRMSSFQAEPKLYLTQGKKLAGENGEKSIQDEVEALLHLPLTMAAAPSQDETSLTAWQVLTLPLDQLAKRLSDTSLLSHTGPKTSTKRFGSFHSISYVKVYANLRLRRVWCSRHLPDHDLPEFQLFS